MQEVSNQQEQSNDNKKRANDIPVYTRKHKERTYRQNEENNEHTPRKKENNKSGKETQVELVVTQNHNTPHAEKHHSVHHHHHHLHHPNLDDHSNTNNGKEHHENRMHMANTEMETVRAQSVWPQQSQQPAHKHFIPLPPTYQAWNNGLQSLPPIAREQPIATTAAHHKKSKNAHEINKMQNDKVIASPINAKECKENGHERSISVLSRRESNRAASHSLRAMLRVNDAPIYYNPISSTINHNAQSKSIEHAERSDKQKLTQNEKEKVNREHAKEAKLEPERKGNVKYNPLRKLSSTVSSIFSGHDNNKNNNKIDLTDNKIEETKKQSKARSNSRHSPLYLQKNYKKRSSSNNNNNTSMYRIPLDQLSSIRQTEIFADNNGDYGNETTLITSNDKRSKSDNKKNDNHNKTHDRKKILNGNTDPKHKIQDHTQYHLEETHQKEEKQEEEEELRVEKERQNGYYTVNLEDEIHLSYDDIDDNINNNHNDDQNSVFYNYDKENETKHTTEEMKNKKKLTKILGNITQTITTVGNHSDNKDNDDHDNDDEVEEAFEALQSASIPTNTNVSRKDKENENGKVKKTRFWTTLQFQHNIARAMIKHNNERVYGLLKKYNKLVAQNEADAHKLFSCTNPLCTDAHRTSTEHVKQQQEELQQKNNEIADSNLIKPHREVLIEDIDYNDDDDDENSYDDVEILNASAENNNDRKESDELATKIWVNQPIKIVKRSILDRVLDPETGYTLMHLAVLTKDIDCIRICLNYGTEAHRVEDLQGDTPLTLAMKRFPSCVMTLFYNGQNVRVHKPLGLQHTTQHHEQRHSFEHSQNSVKAQSTNESKSKMPSLMKKLSSLRNILHRIGGNTSSTTVNSNRDNKRNSNGEGEINKNTKLKHEQEIMQQEYSQTLVHRAVIADALTPPWPERLQFIKMLVSQYHVNAGSTDYYGFTPSMWALQHEPYLLPHELYKPLMRYLNHAARVAAYESEVNKMNGLDYDAILRLAGIPSSSIDRAVSESVTRLHEQEEQLPLHVHHEENVEMNTNQKSNVVKQKQQQDKEKEEKELFEKEKDEMANATMDAAKSKKLAKMHKQDNNMKNDHTIEETRRLEQSPAPTPPETNITHNNFTVNHHETSHALSGASSQR